MTALIIFAVAYVFIFAKAYQQRNVIHNNWGWVPVFSYIMAYLELGAMSIGILDIAENGWHRLLILGFAQGTGGALGCLSAMWIHNRYHK